MYNLQELFLKSFMSYMHCVVLFWSYNVVANFTVLSKASQLLQLKYL